MRPPTAATVVARRTSVCGLDEHRDPEQHRDHGEERPRHDPKGASAVPEVSARELGRGEPLDDRLRSHSASSDV